MNHIKAFWNDEEGLETVEYAIILGLIVVGTITAVLTLGQWVQGQFDTVNDDLAGQGGDPAGE